MACRRSYRYQGKGIYRVRASHELARVSVSSDEPNLVSAAGLLPAATLAQKVGLAELVEARVRLAEHGANGGTKALSVVGSMLAGGDSIDDVGLLRAGAMPALFDQTRAPSTIGTWLRAFKWSNVRELDAVTRGLLGRLWAAGAGPADPAGALTVDLDSTICEVYGRAKQGAGFGATLVRGYHPQLATLAETGQVDFLSAPGRLGGRGPRRQELSDRDGVAAARRRRDRRADGARGLGVLLPRDADTAAKFGVRFSITARQDKRIKAAIEAIPDDAWTPIPYWLSTPEVSGADVADVPYTCFAGTKDAVEARPVVRRVRPTPGTQLALFTTWDYHAMVTDRPGDVLEVEADHRRHAVVEQSIAELKSAGLAHLPSGKFFANAAWLASALAVIAHNLGRAVGALAGQGRATIATLRRQLFTVPGRLVHSARRLHLRLPTRWPWAAGVRRRPHRDHRAPEPRLSCSFPVHLFQEPRRSRTDRQDPHAHIRIPTAEDSPVRPMITSAPRRWKRAKPLINANAARQLPKTPSEAKPDPEDHARSTVVRHVSAGGPRGTAARGTERRVGLGDHDRARGRWMGGAQ